MAKYAEYSDEYYIAKTLNLAKKAAGFTSPNPMVGSIIVKNKEIIGLGYHKKAGAPHAEINALKMAGNNAQGATLYVSLEPCSHFGKTPPCVESIKQYGIKRVVAAIKDPNPSVSGSGFKYLESNGIEIKYGILEDKAKKLNEIFLKNITSDLPFITIKIAISLDGKIGFLNKNTAGGDAPEKTPLYMSSEKSLKYTHNLRFLHDAIMVSANTVAIDNPKLNIRYGKNNNNGAKKKFTRIILDSNLITPLDSKLFLFKEPTDEVIIFTSFEYSEEKLKRKKMLEQKGAIIKEVYYNNKYGDYLENYLIDGNNFNGSNFIKKKQYRYLDIAEIFKICAEYGITSILIESGQHLFAYIILNNLYDKLVLNITPYIIGNAGTIDAFDLINFANLNKLNKLNNNFPFVNINAGKKSLDDLYADKQLIKLKNLDIKKTGDDVFLIYYP
ncbi:MAG: bifunctional diaminohydroxyphosphoribosylaminopyrimidine deaminase/5-amino-6-(5-phosphoribosylamino)uracil reductase RibD [bacterium]